MQKWFTILHKWYKDKEKKNYTRESSVGSRGKEDSGFSKLIFFKNSNVERDTKILLNGWKTLYLIFEMKYIYEYLNKKKGIHSFIKLTAKSNNQKIGKKEFIFKEIKKYRMHVLLLS